MKCVLYFFIVCSSCMIFGHQAVWTHIIYVTPGDAALCPKDSSPCHTLDWYNENSNGSFMTSNTEVRFLNGTHRLSTPTAHIINCFNLTITGFRSSSSQDQSQNFEGKVEPIINCTSSNSGFVFINSSGISITNIVFDSCEVNMSTCNYHNSAALYFCQGVNITLHKVIINKGYGIHMVNVFGSILISKSSFLRGIGTKSGNLLSNARFLFGVKCGKVCFKATTILRISSSQFLDGQGGVSIIVHCPNVSVVIDNVTIRNNTSNNGGNLALSVTDFGYATNKSTIKIINSHIDYGKAFKGGGMRLWSRTGQLSPSIPTCSGDNIHKILDVYNTTFHSNVANSTGGAVYIMDYQNGGYDCIAKKVMFSVCKFVSNLGNGAVMEISKHLILDDHSSPPLNVTFEACEFTNNSALNDKTAILNIIMSHIMLSNCLFTNSKGSAISLRASTLNIYKINRFENNYAMYGGALKICEGSLVFLHNNSNMQFINNSAIMMGGAVFIQQTYLGTSPPCVFQPFMPENTPIDELGKFITLNFVDNSAGVAGDAIYGGVFNGCYTIATYSYLGHSSFFNFRHIVDKVFNASAQVGSSWISSVPQGVCFCATNETTPHYFCQTNHPVIKAYPGQSFNVSAVTVGQLYGTTAGVIQSSLYGASNSHQLVVHDGGKYSNQCITLSYTLFTNQPNATVVLKPSVETYDKSSKVIFTVSLLPCPIGFELTASMPDGVFKCECSTVFNLLKHDLWHNVIHLSCDIDSQVIHVPVESSALWFGCLKFGNSSLPDNESTCDVFVVSHHCNYYCSPNSRNVNITNIDEQCLSGRTGILCGACKSGLSRILGSYYECKPCSNKSLLKFIPAFLLSGVFLVFIVTFLNITVTEGTINGLIVYATVLFRSHYFFQIHKTVLSRHLWIYIAWLNLDPGIIDTCAYDGMTGYHHIWLTFGYSFYLLFLQAAIVILCRKFNIFTRLFGKDVVKVLATLLFLTHSQMIYACFHTFEFAQLKLSAPKVLTITVWRYDGNIPYLGVKHTMLFVVAVIVSLVTLFCMFSLLFIQCLQRCSGHWCLRWVERLRPFFEAYTGPCNDNYRFWPGLIYVLRTVLCGISMYLSSAETRLRRIKMILISAFCMVIICLACIFPHGVYKKWPLNMLEFSFLFNLCILCVFLGLAKYEGKAICISISFSILICIGILIYHMYMQIRKTRSWKNLEKWFSVSTRKIHKMKFSKESNEDELLISQPLPAII